MTKFYAKVIFESKNQNGKNDTTKSKEVLIIIQIVYHVQTPRQAKFVQTTKQMNGVDGYTNGACV